MIRDERLVLWRIADGEQLRFISREKTDHSVHSGSGLNLVDVSSDSPSLEEVKRRS